MKRPNKEGREKTTTVKDIRTKPLYKSGKTESKVLAACMRWLKKQQIYARRNNAGFGDIGGTGRPFFYGIRDAGDIIACVNGRYVEIECKHGNGGLWRIRQQQHAEYVKKSGGYYFVVHNTDELAAAIEPLRGDKK